MKKIFTSLTVVIALVLLMTITVSAAFSSSVLSNPTYSKNIDGIKYVEATASEGGTQKIFYGEYDTTSANAEYEWVVHSVREGSNTTLSTVMNIAKDYEAETGRKVMLAVNGDYFENTGANVDSYVNNGIVVKKGNFATKNCIGFDNNGKVVVGRMTETEARLVVYDANGNPQFFKIDKFNAQPANGEIAIYNTPGTYTVTNAGAMVVKAESTNLTSYPVWGSDYTMTATGVQNSKSFTLKSGQYAVVYTSAHNDVFGKHIYGEKVDLVEIPAGEFAGCTWVVGGYDVLVDNFVANTNCHDDNSGNAAAPRTFIGFKEDGTGFVCVVDGRYAGGSVGITVEQEAQLAKVLGAQYALELDGGGSSTMVVRINDTLTLRNNPSDGSMRKVSNAVLLVEKPKTEAPHEHSYVDGKCECGETDPNYNAGSDTPHNHYWNAATCTSPRTCECGQTLGAALGHKYVDGVCTRCQSEDPEYIPPHEHNFVEGKCECGEEDPNYQDNTPTQQPAGNQNSFAAWIQSIIDAIIKFFMELFS
ncbi:MAG: phosphodiester glycosidase family protein [Clostridia bacterium]|nr:phosphodiester glycosidase family protein [Clostridia bacterium]